MAERPSATMNSGERELIITRVFDAPPGLVFKAWTEPERLARWSGPRGFTTVSSTMDLRPGGAYRACIRSPEGADHCMRGVYREIVEPERLVFTFAWEEADGTPGREMLVTVSFAEHEGKTRMTFHQALFESVADRDGHRDGWSSSFDMLAEYLADLATDQVEDPA
jgi:uncharacterized protein YndB with AHSA1/START domain